MAIRHASSWKIRNTFDTYHLEWFRRLKLGEISRNVINACIQPIVVNNPRH